MGWQFGRSRREPSAEPIAAPVSPEAVPAQIDDLLEDMRDLRLTLAADLSAAAGAAESGSADVAAAIVEADRRELARFVVEARDHLRGLNRERQDRVARRRRRWVAALPAIPLAGAVAMSAAAATGVLPLPHDDHPAAPSVQGSSLNTGAIVDQVPSSMRHFAAVVSGDSSARDVIAAASRLHRHLQQLIDSSGDPQSVAEARHLLNLETAILLSQQPPGTKLVLSMTRSLAQQLQTVLPDPTQLPTTDVVLPTAPDVPDGTDRHHHRKTTETKDSPTPKPSDSASPSPSPSGTPDNTPTLPALPD